MLSNARRWNTIWGLNGRCCTRVQIYMKFRSFLIKYAFCWPCQMFTPCFSNVIINSGKILMQILKGRKASLFKGTACVFLWHSLCSGDGHLRDLFGPHEGSIRSACHQLWVQCFVSITLSVCVCVCVCVVYVKGAGWLPFELAEGSWWWITHTHTDSLTHDKKCSKAFLWGWYLLVITLAKYTG